VKPFFVYMLRCRNGSYYVGSTDDLETRVNQHQHGTFGGHTARLRPVTLVWSVAIPTRDQALVLEFQVKRWSRAKKEALIAGDWEALKRAARGRDRARPSTPGSLREPYARGDRGRAGASAGDADG
jgi:predicted GIY-YIG superfamily endonuclease